MHLYHQYYNKLCMLRIITKYHPGRIVWPPVRQICTSQTEKFSRYTLILYFSPIKYWRNCRKICQTVSDRPKIIEKFSQPAEENGHVLLPGVSYNVNVQRWPWQVPVCLLCCQFGAIFDSKIKTQYNIKLFNT